MCWVYHHPERWDTVKRAIETASSHEAALPDGKVTSDAPRQQWREFAREIMRHAYILKYRHEHRTEAAERALEHCQKLLFG